MPILPLALPSGSSVGREPHAGIARLINCYAVDAGPEQRAQAQIWAAPGLDPLVTLSGSSGVRGLLEVDGIAHVVAGRSLYQVDSGGNYIVVGGIPSDGYVGMARNQRDTGVQVIIACDGLSWVSVGGTLTAITDSDLPPPIDVCVVNRSAIFATSDGRMFRSDIDDATSIDGLDVAEAESAPDGLFRVVDRGGDLIAIGSRSFEVWSDTGGEAFGFSRAYAARMGAAGPKCVTKAGVITQQTVTDTVAWVSQDQHGAIAGIVMLDGYTPRKISTYAEDLLLRAETTPGEIVATSWVMDSQGFIAFRLADRTIVYNTTTQRWHDRQSRDSSNNVVTWRASLATVLGGRVLVGDADNPKLYWLDPDEFEEDGDNMVVTVRTPTAHAFPGRLGMDHLYLDVVPGVGLATGDAEDVNPVITMRYSHDNETWSSGRDRTIGAQAKRLTRVNWSRLGTFDQATFEFSCSAAVVRGFMGARWDGETLRP